MTDAQTSAHEWVAGYAIRLGVAAPTDPEVEALLELAAVAAHSSERIAAPLACWLVGRSGVIPAEALESARRVTD